MLGNVSGNSAEAIEEANAGLVVNPFWSQRAQDEARLQAARPHHLEEAASDSTEMRLHDEHPMPVGTPVSFGPSASSNPLGSGNEATPGLRPGERQVLSQMKDIMEVLLKQNQELAHQNAGLQQRIDKLEEERTSSDWRSVGSGGGTEGAENSGVGISGFRGLHHDDSPKDSLGRFVPPETLVAAGDRELRVEPEMKGEVEGSVVFQKGFEEGYQAAKQVRDWEETKQLRSLRLVS